MTNTVIRVENLSKKYMIGHQQESHSQYVTLRDAIADGFKLISRRFFNRKLTSNATNEEFWALKDISFEIMQGEVVGIIGSNGAGKSTLLKILSRITEPTKGRVSIQGRVASLLEVGTGFHPELTGRENIYLNGAILGMSKAEIKKKFDEIVAFAEVERFLDTPVKRYSSGMYVRLAFAVAAHLDPEILVVDEVLAVGDIAFQKKCLGKMGEVATKEGRTVLFVSHNMQAVQELCQRAILLERGNVVLDSHTQRVVSSYLQKWHENLKPHYKRLCQVKIPSSQKACLLEAELLDAAEQSCEHLRFGEPFAIRMLLQHFSAIPAVAYAIRIYDSQNRFLSAVNTLNEDLSIEDEGLHDINCKFTQNILVPGEYYISIGCYIRPHTTVYLVEPCLSLVVQDVSYNENKPFTIMGNPVFAMLDTFWNKK